MSINFDQKFNLIKEILRIEGINDFSGFDSTFVEFFITSISEDSLSRPELFDMLQALSPETANFAPESKKDSVLDSIIQIVKQNSDIGIKENKSTSKISSTIEEVHADTPGNTISNGMESKNKLISVDANRQLAEFEVSMVITQLKAIFKDNNIRIVNPFDTDTIMTLVCLVKETDNRELILDIVCQFFPSTIGNTYVQEQIIKTLKSSKVITSDHSSSNKISKSQSNDDSDDFTNDTTEDMTVMENLKNQLPYIDDDIIRYVFKIVCAHNQKQAFKVLSTNNIEELTSLTSEYKMKRLEERNEQNRENSRIKALVTKNYSETQDLPLVDENGKLIKRPAVIFMSTVGGGNQKVRYRDGIVVSNRGEKVIVEKNPFDDYDGGSRGKVKTKRKGGVGWV